MSVLPPTDEQLARAISQFCEQGISSPYHLCNGQKRIDGFQLNFHSECDKVVCCYASHSTAVYQGYVVIYFDIDYNLVEIKINNLAILNKAVEDIGINAIQDAVVTFMKTPRWWKNPFFK